LRDRKDRLRLLRVRRLAEQLRATGLRVWFDDGGALPRRRYGLAIERGLKASRTLVLCPSPAALGSDWVGLGRSTDLFYGLRPLCVPRGTWQSRLEAVQEKA